MRLIKNSDHEHLKEVTSLTLIDHKSGKFDAQGIFSPSIFGSDDFSCECGKLVGAWHSGELCEHCGTSIIDPKDNIYRNGRFKLPNGLKIFNPTIFQIITKHVKKFNDMIDPSKKHIDVDGHIIYQTDDGLELVNYVDFSYKYKETIEKVIPDNVNIAASLDDDDNESSGFINLKQFLLDNEESVMLSSIQLLPIHLRPSQLNDKQLTLEPLNRAFISINTHIDSIKKTIAKDDLIGIDKELFEIQKDYQQLLVDVISIIAKKEGISRDQILSNRINYSGRAVITLKHDNDPTSIIIPKIMFTEMYAPKIVSRLSEYLSVNFVDAYEYYCLNRFDFNNEVIQRAINDILDTKPVVIINRNPSLHLESLRACFVSGVSNDYTIKLCKSLFRGLNADLDDYLTVKIQNTSFC